MASAFASSLQDESANDFAEACLRSILEAELYNSMLDAEIEDDIAEACRLSLAECDTDGVMDFESGSMGDVSPGTLAAIQACGDMETIDIAADMETEDIVVGALIPPEELRNTANHSLAVVSKALSRALAGGNGASLLALSCPVSLDVLDLHARTIFQEMINLWLANFLRIAASMPVDVTDDACKHLLKMAVCGMMQVVELAIWYRFSDHNEIEELTKQWIISFVVNVTGGYSAAEGMDMSRLDSLFSVASRPDVPEEVNVHEALSRFGCKMDSIQDLQDEAASALLRKLQELQDTGEEDIFTCRQLVVNGRISAGLGLVVRRGSGEHNFHVFVYDLGSLRTWVERSNEDPLTRHPLDAREIVEIS